MMRLFNNVDKKFEELGFTKTEETSSGVYYERESSFGYTHVIAILHKYNGEHLIQSYQATVNPDGFNNMVGMTKELSKLALAKLKQMKF